MKLILLNLVLFFCTTLMIRAQKPAPTATQGRPDLALEPPMSWRIAREGWRYEWPRDHASHAGFKTEWWYFTGNLRTTAGRRFGYQLTFFRQGVRLSNDPPVRSRFVVNDLKFGHFTMTDVQTGSFAYFQQITRGSFGEAGFGDGGKEPRLAWLGPWELRLTPSGSFQIRASEAGQSLDLVLAPSKPLAVHGENGISRKAQEIDRASHYYSSTRLRSKGNLVIAGETFLVSGESWFDHEWATNQLTPQQAGWDWYSLQFNDDTELMLYRLRRKDGTLDRASSGSFIAADGTVRHLQHSEIEVRTLKTWRSQKSGAEYPNRWRVQIPSLKIDIEVSTPVEQQELVLQPVTYWEGLVDLQGNRAGNRVTGHGYVELTGYAGPIVGLSSPNL